SRWDYDAAGQLTRQNYTDVAGIDYGYEYDSNGLLTRRTGDGAQWSYRYDAIDRLVAATHGAETYSYQYDALGNRLEAGQQYDAFNKLLEDRTHTYEYDAAGNLVKKINKADNRYQAFSYNNRGRMVRFEDYPAGATTPATIAEYAHDALGRRVLKSVNGTVTRFQWQGNSIVAEYDSNNALIKQYRYALGFAPLQYKTTNGVYDVHADQLSTPRAMTDQAGSTAWATNLTPYGVADITRGESFGFNIRFPGQYADGESGLYYNRFRDYAPGTGRYVQSDPLGLYDGPNSYTYVYNNPINYADPTGQYGVAGGVYGAISGGIGGYISGGWQGALAGAGSGALVGAVNPFGANAAGAAAGAGVASLLGQGAGNLVSGNDVTDPCNYDFSAAAGAALGGALGGPLGNALGRYVGPYRFPIIGRPLGAPGISNAPGNTVGSIVEGVSVGAGELAGQQF
ncbi:RHS repeat-associated core domain-containing protein, partial [Endozoicomonas sp. ALB115]|uniref:RHS repeat-associated core domain-containing protein n=2 Tax=Endozoicomonas TaxID=305899 RepID=UPI003BB7EF9B